MTKRTVEYFVRFIPPGTGCKRLLDVFPTLRQARSAAKGFRKGWIGWPEPEAEITYRETIVKERVVK